MAWRIQQTGFAMRLLQVALLAIGSGCSQPGATEPPSVLPAAPGSPVVENVAAADLPAILRLAEALDFHGIARVFGYSADACNVFERPRALDELATSQRVVNMRRTQRLGPEVPDTLTVDGWETSRSRVYTCITAHVRIAGETLDVSLSGEDPISSADALRIVSALADGSVGMPDAASGFSVGQVTGIRRPVHIASEILALAPPHDQWDDFDVEVGVTLGERHGLFLILHVTPLEVRWVSWVTYESSR
jgi:hypothetical protein